LSSVEPDVEDVPVVPGDRHPPAQLGARQRDVLQPLADERARLVEAVPRDDEVRLRLVEPLELLLKGGQAEEVVLLLLAVERNLVDQAAVAGADLGLGLEVSAAWAVPPVVHALVHVAVVVDPLEDLLDALDVLGVRGADEEVIRDPEAWSAASATDSPCSSVPVRKNTSSPR
jgi:hypothetical protein